MERRRKCLPGSDYELLFLVTGGSMSFPSSFIVTLWAVGEALAEAMPVTRCLAEVAGVFM